MYLAHTFAVVYTRPNLNACKLCWPISFLKLGEQNDDPAKHKASTMPTKRGVSIILLHRQWSLPLQYKDICNRHTIFLEAKGLECMENNLTFWIIGIIVNVTLTGSAIWWLLKQRK